MLLLVITEIILLKGYFAHWNTYFSKIAAVRQKKKKTARWPFKSLKSHKAEQEAEHTAEPAIHKSHYLIFSTFFLIVYFCLESI